MNTRERFKQKNDFIVEWIVNFKFSTPKVLCLALGLKRENQGGFFSALKRSGLFIFVRTPLIMEEILILSHSGKEYASTLSSLGGTYSITKSRVVSSTLIHSLCIQKVLIKRGLVTRPFPFTCEHYLNSISFNKRPDALFEEGGVTFALEVELTQKNSQRIYLGFVNHIELMKKGTYKKVFYVFPDEALMLRYTKRFNEESWPMFFTDKHGKIRPKYDNNEQLFANANSEAIRNRFSFTFEDMY